jgi:hypothetical protein
MNRILFCVRYRVYIHERISGLTKPLFYANFTRYSFVLHNIKNKTNTMPKAASPPEKPSLFDALWPEGEELAMVNGDQFNPRASLEILRWNYLGGKTVTDPEKIKTRQDGLKLLIGSKAMRHVVGKYNFHSNSFVGKDFFEEYGSRAPFNKKVRHLIRALKSGVESKDVSFGTSAYAKTLDSLQSSFEKTMVIEDEMIKKLGAELENIYSYNGIVSVTTTPKYQKNEQGKEVDISEDIMSLTHDSYGFKDYAFLQEKGWLIRAVKFFLDNYAPDHKNNWELVGIRTLQVLFCWLWLACTIILSQAEKNRNDALYTRKLPVSVSAELIRLHESFVSTLRSQLMNKLSEMGFDDIVVVRNSVSITTEFQYVLDSEKGFSVRLIDVTTKTNVPPSYIYKMGTYRENDFGAVGSAFIKGDSVYTKIRRSFFQARSRKLANTATEKSIKLPLQLALESALGASRELLVSGKGLVSEKTYQEILAEVKYSNINNAIDGMNLKNDWETVLHFRKSVQVLFSELGSLNAKAKTITATRQQYSNLPFCFPTVVPDDKNIVSFDNLAPVHLIGMDNKNKSAKIKSQELRLITGLPALNGQMVSLTGQNGGGKTATEVEMINALYQAHMGLPVFADHFTFNAKDVIAMVFVEKGQGSMLQVLMQKLKSVAEEVKTRPNNKIVVIIDELLTGTQEKDGLDIGKKYLRMLSQTKCSIMFVTQITQLAEFSQAELGAACFYFAKDGSMKPGIGTGNAYFLSEEVGLDKYL